MYKYVEFYIQHLNSRRTALEMSMLLSEILLSRKPRTRPPDYGANIFYSTVVLNSYTLLKRTKEDVLSELICVDFRQCKYMQVVKYW